MEVLYANRRAWRVRLLQWGFWAVAALFLALGLLIRMGSGDQDATALLILAPIMAAFALGMELYRSLYVTRIAADGSGVEVETLGAIGRHTRRLSWDELVTAPARRGEWHARGQASTAALLRPPGARLPWIIDTTEDDFREEPIARRLSRRGREARTPR
ncbi:hypothetical protein [Roseomonas sp. HF4]|uniref:hypothetical protein n=1 Tax=Roseomonas sp. HF4 TaxID=2562313 RepID=UPI0010C04ED9|nr:hypothetical protein [Roseomonas sp. HF4]